MINNNQGRRQVAIDEETLRQLLEQAGMQPANQGQYPLVPVQNNLPNEFQVVDVEALNSGELQDAVELDLNRNRNKIMRSTFGQERR